MNVVSFSGGKDSTAMLLMMLEKGMQIDKVLFVDTSKEFPDMIKHIEQVKEYIYPLKIETAKMDFDYWLGERVLSRGKRRGNKGLGWAFLWNRWCTQLKTDTFTACLLGNKKTQSGWPSVRGQMKQNTNITQFIGIAEDEKHRKQSSKQKLRTVKYPLVDWHITEKQALEYCYSKGFTWNGLYEKFQRVSCWCCPFSRIGELRVLYNEFPELWEKLVQMDKKSFRRFRDDYSVKELSEKFIKEQKCKK